MGIAEGGFLQAMGASRAKTGNGSKQSKGWSVWPLFKAGLARAEWAENGRR